MAAHPALRVTAAFPDTRRARAARDALVAAGLRTPQLSLVPAALPQRGGEAPFLWRVLVVIVAWSIAGGVAGAVFGVVLALTIGPSGAQGLILQVVVWAILGHLVVGMLAGYLMLADRSEAEMPPDRASAQAVLTVHCQDTSWRETIVSVLREHGASGVQMENGDV